MTHTIKFYREDNRWYADLPEFIEQGGSKEACEMVAGADTWLEELGGEKGWIVLTVSDKRKCYFDRYLALQEVDENGATYKTDTGHELWLCPVTLFVFNQYPQMIYYS
jgi:hypothetical protein